MARAAGESLTTYRRKRDFARTAEPAGDAAPSASGARPIFVVQRHRARRLHYDLRLEIGGALASWAVPKGPTLDADTRSLAVHVEDHPLDYADFEGTIPAGAYGGGDVIVWDRGTWSPAKDVDPASAVEAGELHFDLHGEKLAGRFVLVRTDRGGRRQEQWLLLHKRDDAAVAGWDPEQHPHSVVSGRTNDDVAAGRPARPVAPEWSPPDSDELDALDALGTKGTWSVGGRTVSLGNLDKELFPATPAGPAVTKRDVVRHYASMAPLLAPYLAERPVNLHRLPNGIDGKRSWHKAVPSHAPDWLRRWRNEAADPGEPESYAILDGAAALAFVVNFGALELHPWTSTIGTPDEPTWALIDIDPGVETDPADVLALARLYRTALDHLGVDARPRLSGRRGIQVFVPVGPGYKFDDTRRWVEQLSRAIGATVPDLVSWSWRTGERGGRARLDDTQNAIDKTLVAPWCLRATSGAPVSVPIGWDELDDDGLRSDRWTIRTVDERVAVAGDPLRPLVGLDQRLPDLDG